MQASSLRVVGRKIAGLNAPIRIVLALASHASLLNHTLCLHAFLLLFFRLCRSTVRQIMALALELPYVRTYRLHVQTDWR